VNRRLLFVDADERARERAHALFGPRFDVYLAADAEETLELLRRAGPFAVVVARSELAGRDGVELLGRVREACADTVRIVTTAEATLELAIRALHNGAVFRCLNEPVKDADLLSAVEDGVELFQSVAAERLLTEQLQFSREALISLTESLERRLADQFARLRGLHELAHELSRASSLRDVARLTARRASRILDGRGIHVALETDRADAHAVAGRALADEVHTVSVLGAKAELGRITVDALHPARLTRKDRDFIASIAASTAVAADAQIHRLERERANHATMLGLARLAEHRDDDTGKHLERVAEYCRVIAEGLRADGHYVETIDDKFIDDIVLSSPLHDIGKVGIPDSILKKPGKLTDDEWEIMRRHPAIGAETLRNVLETSGEQRFLRMAHEVAWCHHERWSGGGYPRGLAGEEIPLSARIMAIADCYDALTTWRPYKEPWPHEKALALIQEESGEHFDPKAVASFVSRAQRADAIRRHLADEPQVTGSVA